MSAAPTSSSSETRKWSIERTANRKESETKMTDPSPANTFWVLSLLVLFLLLFGCCPAVVSALKPIDCQLYRVDPDGDAPQYDLDLGTKTYITLETILTNTQNLSQFITEVRLEGRCLLGIYYDHPRNEPKCTIEIVYKARVNLMIQVVDGRVWVFEGGSREEWEVVHDLSIYSTTTSISITTTTTRKHFVQVAFNCPEGCFQFRDAVLHKTIGGGQEGFLVYYGRQTKHSNLTLQFGNISLLYRNDIKPLELGSFLHNVTDWIKFSVLITFSKKLDNETVYCKNIYRINDTVFTIDDYPSNKIFISNRPCSWEPTLLLSFTETHNMEWSTCIPPEGTTTQYPSTHACASVLPWVLGAAMVVLVILEVALCLRLYFVRRQKKAKISDDAQPVKYPATVPDEAEDDPANHVYDYVDMAAFNGLRRKEEEERGRRGVSESNSPYGQVFPGRKET